MATTKTSDKSENAITKQENSSLNFDRKHMQHFVQTEAPPSKAESGVKIQGRDYGLQDQVGRLHHPGEGYP